MHLERGVAIEPVINLVGLDISDPEVREAVLQLQRVAYRVEAELIGSDGIPPLWETLDDLQTCSETFLGAFVDGRLAGAISWRFGAGTIDIHRLVVHPDQFRRGVATALVRGALENEPAAERAIVQTGAENAPAAALYLREGFERIGDVELSGLRISRFEKSLRYGRHWFEPSTAHLRRPRSGGVFVTRGKTGFGVLAAETAALAAVVGVLAAGLATSRPSASRVAQRSGRIR
jgi:ribosomal protein S18 acetylase RimI-like enzyme